jgi:regulator of sigma E protease
MSVIIFFLVLFILILVHEWGHFIVAKKTGMRVDEFGIGFPPKMFGWRRKGDETEYTFNWLPIGGFVKIWGENYDEETSPVSDGSAEGGVSSEDRSRAFSNRPKWAQALVLVAGVTMNVLFAWLLFAVTYMIGVPTAVDEAKATESAQLLVSSVLADSPAAELPAGSIITEVSFNEQSVVSPTPTEFSELVTAAKTEEVTISYRYGEVTEVVVVEPVQGLIESDPDRYAVGASLSLIEIQQRSFFVAIADGFTATWQGLVAISSGLWSLISQSVAGEADFSQIAGPVGIVGMVGDAASFGIAALLTFTAIISLNLAIINLLPFPALDGGRLVFVAIEAITQKQIPSEWAGRVNLVGFALLMLLMIAVTYNDILRLL